MNHSLPMLLRLQDRLVVQELLVHLVYLSLLLLLVLQDLQVQLVLLVRQLLQRPLVLLDLQE